jgi:hypothetical protein
MGSLEVGTSRTGMGLVFKCDSRGEDLSEYVLLAESLHLDILSGT